MTPEQTKQWLERCFNHESLFEPDRALFRIMIDALPDTQEEVKKECITTSRNKELSGKELDDFIRFWDAFDHKSVSSRAAAATSWLKIKDEKTPEFMDHIVAAAKYEATTRTDPAKHAQGWLTERRWEAFSVTSTKSPKDFSNDEWVTRLGAIDNRFMREHMENHWPRELGPSPWDTENTIIPYHIYNVYAEKWGWK